ncbi:MAG TPA: RNA methyltransferase [Thermoanaerobaculia bacterium]|nr:RNA methyltransferase [Thermoanaerobaculia bacterium]HUM28778.1 RNA methyltransferase [Thermoanaerobaculia bacterium]HXK67972.1 RNA methyltransferase [Thermoanaerobaculia bacterium]
MILTGYHASKEVLLHRANLARILYLEENRNDHRARELETLARSAGVPIKRSPSSFFLRQGAAGSAFAIQVDALPQYDDNTFLSGLEGQPVLLIEEVSDPQNLGSIFRVAECSGFSHVALTLHRTAPVNDTVMTASAGAAAHLTLGRVRNTTNFINHLKELGYWVVGTAVEGGNLYSTEIPPPFCIVVGSEEKGLRRITREACDELVALPVLGRIGSLNVANATAAVLYEMVRRTLGETEQALRESRKPSNPSSDT